MENPNSIVLIDLGGSTTLSKGTDGIVFEFFENESPTLSPWQLEGHFRSAARGRLTKLNEGSFGGSDASTTALVTGSSARQRRSVDHSRCLPPVVSMAVADARATSTGRTVSMTC